MVLWAAWVISLHAGRAAGDKGYLFVSRKARKRAAKSSMLFYTAERPTGGKHGNPPDRELVYHAAAKANLDGIVRE
jgi:hypothetical protein